ncbi:MULTISPECIES: helix-turn-helix domain-containing protein [unclassified Chryseobacterium]|uniref:helix-turn-helix domain-containing protein n=1 Tax=unclassified Chryseobacterium TaxID=2593645 RepID=UPI000D3DB4C0|nr:MULTISPECIES: helix-turn-helix domain-containing protein [unclassified Chryseobacterium]MCQ4142263.1 helix-turn-helix domain-containing protein [Chryseobacterium sp. EO14]PTT75251.1 DNA-binding protein [Chryseobacterium sp. HMWF001]PVV50775.1 DNA-binding protein [Chryseobacterium sp. HMWF035]
MNYFNSHPEKELFLIQTDSETFYKLTKYVLERLRSEQKKEKDSDFIAEKQAMELLGISSKTTLQKYRDLSLITFYKLSGRKILYSKSSIEAFILSNKESFD